VAARHQDGKKANQQCLNAAKQDEKLLGINHAYND